MSVGSKFDGLEIICDPECPVQCELVQEEVVLRSGYDIKTEITESSLMGDSSDVQRLIMERLAVVSDGGITSPSEADAAEMVGIMRRMAAVDLAEHDKSIDNVVAKRRRFEATCKQPCVLTNTVDGVTYTVTVCTSRELYGDGDMHKPAHVERTIEL